MIADEETEKDLVEWSKKVSDQIHRKITEDGGFLSDRGRAIMMETIEQVALQSFAKGLDWQRNKIVKQLFG